MMIHYDGITTFSKRFGVLRHANSHAYHAVVPNHVTVTAPREAESIAKLVGRPVGTMHV